MATYVIGDIQGCFTELQELLQICHYQPKQDCLWFTGDLVNRGPDSLAVLRFIKNLPRVTIVLGNHDLTLLALRYTDLQIHHHTLNEILTASDRDELLDWLRKQPLLHYDEDSKFLLVHAGLPPEWDLSQARSCAHEVEEILRSAHFETFLTNMYGNDPSRWDPNLKDYDRLRFITNALTRIRFCDLQGNLYLNYKGKIGTQPEEMMPWFKIPNRLNKNLNILFGHWAALDGKSDEPHIFPLDTGCVWGNKLTAMRLEDRRYFQVACTRSNVKKV